MSILRSSKFLRYFVTFARNTVFTRPTEYDNTLLRNSKLLVNSNFSYASQSLTQNRNIDKSIQKLDQDVRRSGRITKRELEEVFSEIRSSKHATSSQSLLIIRCCGNLVPEERPEVRTKLVNEIWSTFEKLGVMFDISHYNALLRVYLENEHQFSPSEFLANLETKGIEPNRVTYQRLIASYCQRGDIEGATRILEFMKEKQMPVNEYVFNSLIMGHFQANDVKSAVGILGVMKQANVKPSAETYSTLMCGYAKTGDIAAIKEVLSQCEQEDIYISDKDILEVMYILAINKHTDLIEQLGDQLKKSPGFNQDTKNVILRLLVKGEDEAAIKLFRMMTPITPSEGESIAIGNFLIRQMVKCQRPVENIIKFCDDLKKSGENNTGIFVATEASLSHGKPEMSLKLLTELAKEHELCHHYYWPILVRYGKMKDFDGVTDTLKQMIQEIGQPVSGETLRDYVAPYIPQNEQGVLLLTNGGIPIATSAAAMIGHLLMKNDIKTAASIGLQFRANYTSPQLCRNAVLSFINTRDLESYIKLVRIIVDSSKEESNDIAGKMLLDLVQLLRSDRSQTLSTVLKAYLDSGMAISSQVAEELQNMLNGKELTSDIEELLSKLVSGDLTPLELDRPARQKLASTEDDIIRKMKAATARGEPAWNLKRQLLSHYCLNKELEKAENLRKEMEEEGFDFMVGLNVLMMDLYVHYEKLPEAMKYLQKIFINEDVEIDPGKLIKLVALMVKNNMSQEAIDLISKRKAIDVDSQTDRATQFNLLSWRALNILAENKDVENIRKMFDTLMEKNYISPNNMVLGPLIKVHLLRDDLESALNVFEECCMKYRATPWKNDIACRLIQKEDPVALQKLTDLSTQIHGEINSLYDLVLSFVECGRIRQARKILETPGLRSRTQRLNSACERYDSEGHVTHLENLVEVTKDLHHIDRADIYYHLLSLYCKADEVEKALGLWTQMQDEDVQPSEAFLAKLGSLLNKHGRPVPFAVPTMRVVEEEKRFISSTKLDLKKYRAAVNSKDVDEALTCLGSVKDEDLTKGDRSKLILLLSSNGRLGEATKMILDWFEKDIKVTIKTLSYLMNQLAIVGDVDSLNRLGNKLDKEVKKMTSFNNRIAHCMTEAGRAEEYLATLESKIKAATSPEELQTLKEEFPRGGIFSVLDSPNLIAKFEEVARLYREKGILDPTNVLWSHYIITRNTEKAAEAWSQIKSLDKLLFQPILKHTRKAGDLPMIKELIETYKTGNFPVYGLGLIYSTAIDIAVKSGNFEECEKLLESGIQECTIDNISIPTLQRTKRLFEIKEKEFKYNIPAKASRAKSSSSSSSDSDSDGEQNVKQAAN